MNRSFVRAKRFALLVAASLPLMQVTCTSESLVQSFENQVTAVAAFFTFDVAYTIFSNVLGL